MRSYYKESDDDKFDRLLAKSSDKELNAITNRLLNIHVSTKERLLYKDDFNKQVENHISNAREIIDIGSGIYPMIFPWNKASQIIRYVAIDKNKNSTRALEIYAKRYKRYELKPYEQ